MVAPTVVGGALLGSAASISASPDVSITIPSGANRVLIMVIAWELTSVGTPTTAGVQLKNGATVVASFTQLGTSVQAGAGPSNGIEVWYLLEAGLPAPGAYTVHPTSSNAPRATNAVYIVQDALQQAPQFNFGQTSVAAGSYGSAVSITPPTNNALITSQVSMSNEDVQTAGDTLVGSIATASGSGLRTSVSSFAQTTAAAKAPNWTVTPNFARAEIFQLGFEEIPNNSITLSAPANGQVIQRVGTSATVTYAGTYSGTAPTTIDVQVTNVVGGAVVVAWTTLSGATIGGGTWSGTLANVPQGGLYYAQPRSNGGALAVGPAPSNKWGVGKLILLCGSSTMRKFMDLSLTTPTPADSRLSSYNGVWGFMATTGCGGIALGNALIAADGIPVGFLDYGVTSSTLASWATTTAYAGYNAAVAAITANGGTLEKICIHVGSNDARSGGVINQATQESRHRTLHSALRTYCGQASLQIVMTGCQRAPLETNDADWTRARAAELNVSNDANHLFVVVEDLSVESGQTPADANSDNVHMCPSANVTFAGRIAGVLANGVLGPKPSSASYDTATGNLDMVFTNVGQGLVNRKNDGSFTVDVSCFVVRNAALAAQTITSATITSTTTVRLVTPAGLGTGVTAEYMAGCNPGITTAPAVNCLFAKA